MVGLFESSRMVHGLSAFSACLQVGGLTSVLVTTDPRMEPDVTEMKPTVISPNRRTFLRWAAALGASLSALLAGLPSLLAFISPAFQRRAQEKWVKLGEADLFDIGVPVQRVFSETVSDAWVETRVQHNVWLFTEDGEQFTAFNGRCTHLGCGYNYDAENTRYHCPCHHGLFDLKTGAVLGGPPPRALDTLSVKVEDGDVYVLYQDFRIGIADKVAV